VRRATALRTLVALGALLAGRTPARAQTVPALRVATSPSDAFAEAIYAQGAGFFKEAGLSVELVSLANSGSLAAAVAGGAIDIGLANPIAVASARSSGLPLAVIAPSALFTAKEPATVLIVAKSSPLTTAKDLEGKTVAAIEVRGTQQASIRQWMAKNGADASGVKFVEVPFTTMAAMLDAGRVDAAMIGEPALSAAKPLVRVFASPYEAVAPEWYLNVWFAGTDWLQKNRTTARTFVAVMNKTATWANAHQAETGVMLQKFLPLTDDVVARMTRAQFAVRLNTQYMQPILDTAAKYGVLKTPADAKDMIFPDL
jgi:NitT/TauT family transport system substrate-binding protein